MNICDFLRVDKILFGLHGTSKSEIIDHLVSLFADDERVRDCEKMRQAVHNREGMMSTAVGNSFAIPHAKTDSVTEIIIAFGLLDRPVDFEALDGRPVDLVFLIVTNESRASLYVQLLSRIATIMKGDRLREKLTRSKSAREIFDLINREEGRYWPS